MFYKSLALSSAFFCVSFATAEITSHQPPFETHGSVEGYDPEFNQLVAPDTQMEVLATGFRWSEGPAWDSENNRLLFTDVPENTAYAWTEESGVSIFLQPSGHKEMKPDGVGSPGANGLAFNPEGQLALCQHGNRRVALYNEATGTFTTLTDRYGEREFYSPNDLVFAADGTLFFTDPPYGLTREARRSVDTHYVFRRDVDGSVHPFTDSIRFPNGISLSPDEKTLYIAVSDFATAGVLAYQLDDNRNLSGTPTRLLDASRYVSESRKGGCDGMAIDEYGNIWATGPGGVYVIEPKGDLIGFLHIEGRLANCAFGGADGSTFYITAADKLLRIKTKVKGLIR